MRENLLVPKTEITKLPRIWLASLHIKKMEYGGLYGIVNALTPWLSTYIYLYISIDIYIEDGLKGTVTWLLGTSLYLGRQADQSRADQRRLERLDSALR